MNRMLIYILMGLSALVIALSILFNIGNSHYIDDHLLVPASIIFGTGMIASSISGRKTED